MSGFSAFLCISSFFQSSYRLLYLLLLCFTVLVSNIQDYKGKENECFIVTFQILSFQVFWVFFVFVFFGRTMRHVGSSPTRDQTRAPCSGSAES